jgi:hypothetical protein
VAATGRIIAVNLDDTGVEIVVEWDGIEETIRADGDSLQAAHVRRAAAEVVEGHLDHLKGGGYTIGEPRPGDAEDNGQEA